MKCIVSLEYCRFITLYLYVAEPFQLSRHVVVLLYIDIIMFSCNYREGLWLMYDWLPNFQCAAAAAHLLVDKYAWCNSIWKWYITIYTFPKKYRNIMYTDLAYEYEQ